MYRFWIITGLFSLCMIDGCSSETVKRTTYETLQNIREQECMKNPSSDCSRRDTYDQYQKQRKEVE